jgi:hypothetical protein
VARLYMFIKFQVVSTGSPEATDQMVTKLASGIGNIDNEDY